MAKVEKLKSSFDESVKKSEKLKADMQITETRLDRAGKLIDGLSGEKVNWEKQIGVLQSSKGNLVGNMLLAAGAVAYVGPFPAKYRAGMMETWVKRSVELGIPVESTFTLPSLTEAFTIRTWGIKGLPMVCLSICTCPHGCIRRKGS